MKNLTTIKRFVMCAGILICNVTPVWAATGKEDNSDLFVWIFLGFCALIVVAQLIPAAMMFMGFAKGTRKRIQEAAPAKMDQIIP
jgi:Na+/melibiose symporter-like transporter